MTALDLKKRTSIDFPKDNPFMKKAYKWAALVLLAGGLASCKVQEVEAVLPVKSIRATVHFSAAPLETRTVFGEPSSEDGMLYYPTLWTENDTEVGISLNYAAPVPAAVRPSENYVRAEFDADFDGVEADAPYTFYVMSPASALTGVSASRKALAFTVPAVQTPSALSADEAAQLLVAKSEAYQEIPENVDVHFSHLTAYGRLTLKNLPEQATVSSVRLVSPEQPWAGVWYYDPEDGSIEAKEVSSSITVKTDASGDIWFACAPVDMKGRKLKISVSTDLGVYEKEITLSGKNVNFSSGNVYRFSVNMSGIDPVKQTKVYRLVKEASALEAGKEVLIVNLAGTYAIGPSSSNNNNKTAKAVTVTNGTIDSESLGSDVQVFVLEAGSSDGSWSFSTGSGYLGTTSSTSNNYLRTLNSKDGWSSWTVGIASDGTAVVSSVSTAGRLTTYYKQIRYNGSSSSNLLFSAYRSTSKTSWVSSTADTSPVAIYMEDYEGGTASDDPILEEDTYGAYLVTGSMVYVPGSNQLSREYGDGQVTFALLSLLENSILEFSGIPDNAILGDAFKLTLVERRGQKVASTQSYSVKVVGEEGAKLWLTDGAGNGFIVKR